MFISLSAIIDKGLQLPHAHGIVIGSGVRIGRNCKIYQNVTIGRKEAGDTVSYPKLEDNVILYPGVTVIGDIVIRKNSSIGANSVVLKSVEENAIHAGVPAKRISGAMFEETLRDA